MKAFVFISGLAFSAAGSAQSDSVRSDTYKSLDDVIIVADRIIDRSSVSDLSLDPKTIQGSQGLFEDPMRSLTFFPGISKGSGDLFSPSPIYVRGGNPDENLFMLDNVRVYFPWYFGGIKSIFNTETIDNLELLSGGFSAKYGNAMSSILNVSTRSGSFEKLRGSVSLGFANSQVTVEAPVIKNKLSILLSLRKTYLDFFINDPKLFPLNNFGDATYKLSWKISDRHQLHFSGLSGYNGTKFQAETSTPGIPDNIDSYGTLHNQSLQWQAIFSDKIYSKLSLIRSMSRSDVVVGRNLKLNIDGLNTGFREDLTLYINRQLKILAGGEYNHSDYVSSGNIPFDPFDLDPSDTTIRLREFKVSAMGRSNGAYLALLGKIKKLNFNVGGRYDYLNSSRELVISPRVSLSYEIFKKTSFRAAWGYFYQPPPADALYHQADLSSQRSTHYIIGISKDFDEKHKGWIEFYQKEYDDLVIYDTALNYSNAGKGVSRGVEMFVSRRFGKFTGWISYAYSISKRRESLQTQETYFAFDQRHVFNHASELTINNRGKFYIPELIALNFSFRTGTPYTPVESASLSPSGWHANKGEPFSYRNPAYHTMGLKIQFKTLVGRRKKMTLYSYIEIWNLYNRRNVMGRLYQYGYQYPQNVNEQLYYSTPFLQAGGVKLQF
jgi:hypothetical protein